MIRPLPLLSPGRLAWLKTLARGPAKRTRGPVGYQCMLLGWTEWDYRVAGTGEVITKAEAERRFGIRWFDMVAHGKNERLTEKGQAALEQHRVEHARSALEKGRRIKAARVMNKRLGVQPESGGV